MTASFKPVSVAIGDLVPHPANVRSNAPETYDPENIAHLKASIAVLGLLQPLLVQKLDGKYAVLAGGRRHAALKELIADKASKGFTAKTKVDCRLVPEECDVTTALSLAENITQAPMNAIDEFEAFARMMEVDGQTPETIAKTFGTTVAAVKGRLRYGLIHPDIRAAARGKVITLDTMKAFAEHPSQEAQREVFEALTKDGGYLQAYTVRSNLMRPPRSAWMRSPPSSRNCSSRWRMRGSRTVPTTRFTSAWTPWKRKPATCRRPIAPRTLPAPV